MDNPKDFEEDENKLSKEELDALLKEVENDSRQVVRREQPVKKKNIRFDMIIAAVIAFVIVVGGVLLVRHFVVNTPSKAEKAVAENPLQDDKYPEITDVVKNYLNAFLIEDDAKRAETIAQYVGNLYDINSVKQRTYVSEYSDVECYTKKGPYDDTYVVYAYYQMGIYEFWKGEIETVRILTQQFLQLPDYMLLGIRKQEMFIFKMIVVMIFKNT